MMQSRHPWVNAAFAAAPSSSWFNGKPGPVNIYFAPALLHEIRRHHAERCEMNVNRP